MSGPIRGLHDVEGKLFAVSGRTLYQISNAGVAIPRGTIPGVGRVGMAHNQKAGGNELIVVNGSGGYVWNTATETFTVVTDEGYPGASVVDFVDGYLMQVEPFGRFLFHSDLADALGYNTLDRFEAETAPDRTVGMIVNHQEVWAFGERTIDVFGNTGSAQGTFQNKGVSIARGCAAKWSPAVVDNGTAWLGDDLKVYHATGYGPVRISTRAIEVALGECAKADIRNAFSFVWEDRSHSVYYLTVPNGPTFGFDFSTRLWHRRASWHPERDISGRWRLADLVKSNGEWIGGDYQTGQLFKLDWDYMMEGCDPLVRERVSPVAHNNGSRFTVDEVELFVTTGGKATECVPFPFQPFGPQIEGEAPDGLTGDPYSFTYTTTPGTGAIARTVLRDTVLPAGWSWDEATATISHDDPAADTVVSLKMRVYDVNGLYADHEDVFLIAQQFHLLISGQALSTGSPLLATAVAIEPLVVEGIPQSTGATVPRMILDYHDGVWGGVFEDQFCYHEGDDFDNFQSGSIPFGAGAQANCMAMGPAGMIVGAAAGVGPWLMKAPPVPSNFEELEMQIEFNEGFPQPLLQIQQAQYLDRYYVDAIGPASGYLGTLETLEEESIDLRWRVVDDNVLRPFFGIELFDGQLWAASRKEFGVGRIQLVASSDGGSTWGDPVIDYVGGQDIPYHPRQPCAGRDLQGAPVLVVLCANEEYFWTSADNFAQPHATGIGSNVGPSGARRIVYASRRFYIVSGAHGTTPEIGNKLIAVTIDGTDIHVSEPVALPISGVRGIATNYVEPADD